MKTEIIKKNSTNYAPLYMNEIKNENISYANKLLEQESIEQIINCFSNFDLKVNPKKRSFHVLTYENTKNMTPKDVDKYFPDVIKEETSHINFMINISNNFSKNDMVNKAIFEETKFIFDINEQIEFSLGLFLEKENFLLGVPALHDVLIMSNEWKDYEKSGTKKGTSDGVFMNEQHKARYKSGKTIKYNEILLTQEQATDFLITMTNLSKKNYNKAKGSVLEYDYKVAFERYNRIYETYIELLLT